MKNSDIEWSKDVEGIPYDFSRLVRKLKANWFYSILCGILMVILGFVYILSTNPTYNVEASVLIKDNNNNSSGNSSNSMMSSLQDLGLLRGASNVNNEKNILMSYPLIRKVVNELQLFVLFSNKVKLRTVPLYKKSLPFKYMIVGYSVDSLIGNEDDLIYEIKIDKNSFIITSSTRSWKGTWNKPLSLPFGRLTLMPNELTSNWKNGLIKLEVKNIEEVTDYYHKSIEINIPDKQTSVINLKIVTNEPQKGKDLIDELISEYRIANVEDNNAFIDSTLKFINKRLLSVGIELDSIEDHIQKFKQINNLADLTVQSQTLITNSGIYEQEVNEKKVQLSMVNSLIEYMNANSDINAIPASLTISDPSVSSAITQYNNLLAMRARLLLSSTDKNPVVLNINKQLETIRFSVISGLNSIKLSLNAGINKMKQNSGDLTELIKRVPAKERTYIDLNRQQELKQELYLYLLQKREESLISKSSTLSNARIVSPGHIATKPIAPRRSLILSLSFVIGLLVPFVIIYIRDLGNTKLRSKSDILALTKIPIIGEIGHSTEPDVLVVSDKSRNIVAEQFRALRSNLQFILPDKKDKIILITSSLSGEGKSFVAINLAMVFCLAGKKVALLEFDLRKPKIAKSLNIKYKDGFTNYAIGDCEIDNIIVPSNLSENLFIIGSGPIPPNPSELLLLDRTEELILTLKNKFDYIVIDTTPNLVADAQTLGKYTDVTLYLMRLDYTHKEQLKNLEEINSFGKLPRINLVVNDIKPKKYGGGYYGYGYGYGNSKDKTYGGYIDG